MTDLQSFASYARAMSRRGAHKPPCPGWVETADVTRSGTRRREACPGCVSASDLARELDPDLFGADA